MNSWKFFGSTKTEVFSKNSTKKRGPVLGLMLLCLSFLLTAINHLSAQVTTLQSWTEMYHNTSTSQQNITYGMPAGSGSNRLLVVAIASSQSSAGSRSVTITYGGRSLTSVSGDMASTTPRQHTVFYYLKEADIDLASSNTLAVTVSGGTTRVTTIWASVYDYVDQTTPIATSQNYNSGTNTTQTGAFGTALSVGAGDLATIVVSSLRSGNTSPRTHTYSTNWTMVDEATWTTTDGVRNGVANRSIPSTALTDNVNVSISGNALVSMTGMVINGCTAPTVSAGAALSGICKGGTSAALGGSVGGSATGGTWSDGGAGGTFSPNATTLNATYTPAASYTGTVTLTLTSTGGSCGVATATKTLAVNAVPTSVTAAASSSTICSGSSINLTSSATSNSGTTGVLLSNNFEGSAGLWTLGNASTGGTVANAAWTIRSSGYNDGNETFTTPDASQFIISSSDLQGSGGTTNTSMISTPFSTVGVSSASIALNHYYRYNTGTDDRAYVEASTNGTSWTTLQTYSSTQGTASAFSTANISLTAGFLGQSTVYLRFRYTGSFDWYWAINSVAVNGTYTTAPAATYSWTSSPAGYTSSAQNPTGISPTVNTTYTVTATNSYGCTATASTSLVTVNTSPDVPAGTDATRCGSGTVTLSASTSAGATIDWYDASSGGSIVSGGTGVTSFTTPSLSTTTTYYAQARNTTTGCLSASRTAVTATVSFPPSISNQNGSSTYGTASTLALTASNTTSYSATGLPTGFSINSSTGVVSIAATAAAGTYSFTVTAAAAGCTSSSATIDYVVDPANLTVTANNVTKCFGNGYSSTTAFTSVGLKNGEAITSATLYSDGYDLYADLGTFPITISGATGASFNAANYNITYVSGTMTVVDVPSFTTQPSSAGETVCQNSTATPLTVVADAGSGTIAGYQWFSNTTASSFGGTVIPGATSASYTPPTTTAGTKYYYCEVVNSNNCFMPSAVSGAIVVNALPAAVTVSGGGIFCNNTVLGASNGSSGTIYFQGTTTNGTSTADASTSVLIDVAGTYYFRAVSAEGCWSAQGSATVVLQAPIVTGVEICAGGTGSLSTTFSCSPLNNQTSGPRDAGTGANVTGVGTLAWTNPGNIAGAGTAGMSVAANTTTNYLRGTNYGFSIPENATINGIAVAISRSSSSTSATTNLRDVEVKLVKNGTIQATNKASTTLWGNLATANYGGVADLWSTTWAPADINNANFGAVLSIINTNTGTTARTAAVDFIQITVTYSIAGTLNWYTQSSGGSSIASGSTFNPVGVAGSGLSNTNTPGTVTYYVECATNAGCRGSADFIINSLPAAPAVTGAERCGEGIVTLSATPGAGEAIDWYDAASGGTALATGSNTFTTPSLSTTTTYYAQARNIAKGCLSSSRSAVSAVINSASSSSNAVSACDSYTWNGNTYTTSGTYVFNTTNAVGCDSVATLVLTVTASTTHTAAASACDSYTWAENGQTYTTSGSYSAVTGCHTEILNLTITASTSNTTTVSACDSYIWSVNGQTYTQSGAYTDVDGCHAEILNLTITASTSNTTTESVCDSYTWSVNGQTYTASGAYTSVSGCHTEILNLTVTASTTHTNSVTAADSYTWAENGQTYTTSGSYSAVTGCHTEVLNLTIVPSTSDTLTISACDSYTWTENSQTYTSSGIYSSVTGFHTHYLNLTITTSSSNSTSVSACDSYTWSVNGQTYTQSGAYTDVDNCHTEILNLTITASTNNSTSISACDSYSWSASGDTYTQSGTYSVVTGCHTETLVLTITASTTHSNSASACDSYTWAENGETYTESGIYMATTGCHTEVLNLTITASSSNTTTATGCDSYVWSVNGQTYTQSGTYTDVNGCATEILVLTISASTSSSESATACESYTWSQNGQTYTQGGTYVDVVGCHTYTLVLTINNGTHNAFNASACNSYVWNGQTYTASGTYEYGYTNENGCASVDTLHLNINPLPTVPGTVSGTTEVCSLIGSATPSTYSIAAVGDAVSYNWTMPIGATLVSGQGTTSIGVTFASALAATNQRIQVASVSDSGCVSATSSIVLSKTIPAIPVAIIGQTNVCPVMGLDSTLTYSVAAVANADSYAWTAPTGAQIISGQGTNSVQVKFQSSFYSGSMTCTAVAACGNRAARSLSLTRLVPTSPVAISGPTSACAYIGTGVQATYSIAPVANATGYLWTVPNNVTIVSGQGTTSIVVTFSGAYNATSYFKVRSLSTCLNTADRQLAVTAATFSAPGPISGPTNACPYINAQDALATYKIRKVANVSSYIWTVPAGVTIVSHPAGTGANDTVINVSFNSNFVYGSQILVQTAGCGASAARSIRVNGTLPSAPGIISGPANVCEFMVSSTNPNGNIATYTIRKVVGASQYIWNVPNEADIIAHPAGTGENDTTIQVKYEDDFNSGLVSVRSYNACGSSSQRTLSVGRLNPASPAQFDVAMIGACPNRVYTYTLPSMPANATSVVWTIPAVGTIISGQGTASITVSYPTSQVGGQVTAQSFNNCSSSGLRILNVKLAGCPSSFAGGENPAGKVEAITSADADAQIAPNPTTAAFNISLTGFMANGEKVKVKVMDVQGRVISLHTMMPADRISIGNELKAGSYLVQITQGNKTITKRVMKF